MFGAGVGAVGILAIRNLGIPTRIIPCLIVVRHLSLLGFDSEAVARMNRWQLDTIPQDRSHLRGTGPSSYGTGPILFNKIGPVPNWTFSWINTILSLIWARSHGFLLIFAPTIWQLSAVQLYMKQYKLQKAYFYSWNVNLRAIWVQSHHQLA